MRSLLQSLMGPVWDCPSAAPSLNRIAAACGLLTTLRAAQVFTSVYPPKSRHMTDAPVASAWGLPSFIAISSLSGRCKTSYRTLKPFQMPSRTFRQSRQRSRRAAAARQDRPARTIGRFFRVKRCFSAQVDIQIRTSTTRQQARLPRRVRGRRYAVDR